MRASLLTLALVGAACSSPAPVAGVWRPKPGESTDRIPGPIDVQHFGAFKSFPDALKAACPLILSKPNATVSHIQDRKMALRVSTEYCAWLYYTPDDTYELSMLSDLSAPGARLGGKASCYLPPIVDDPRYAPEKIKYIFALHNHPFGGELSDRDIAFAVEMANAHEWFVTTKSQGVHFSAIAFFSKSTDGENPSCDGFYQYAPATNDLLLWTHDDGKWGRKKLGSVVWTADRFFIQRAEP